MPTPLFPFTWQYNNQPIEILAENIAGLVVNTDKFVPVSDGLTFQDSTLVDDAVSLRTRYLVSPGTYEDKGFKLEYAGGKYNFGDYNAEGNSSTLSINDSVQTVKLISQSGAGPAVTYFGLDGLNSTLIAEDAITATTAGSAAAKFLKIKVGSVDYKIQLLGV